MESQLTKIRNLYKPLALYYLLSLLLFVLKLILTNERIILFTCKVIYDISALSITLLLYYDKLSHKIYPYLIALSNKISLFLVMYFDLNELSYLVLFTIDTQFYLKFIQCRKSLYVFSTISWLIAANMKIYQMNHSFVQLIYLSLCILMEILPYALQMASIEQYKMSKIAIQRVPSFAEKYSLKGNKTPKNNHQKQVLRFYSFVNTPALETPQIYVNNEVIDDFPLEEEKQGIIQINSGSEISQIMSKIKVSIDEKLIIEDQIKRERIWKERMNGMPVGVVMIQKNSMKIIYNNKSILKLLKKVLKIEVKDFEESVLNRLTFKIIDMGIKSMQIVHSFQSILYEQEKGSASIIQRKSSMNYQKKLSIIKQVDQEEDYLHNSYTLKQILQKLQNDELNNFINEDENTLELYSFFGNDQQLKNVHLNCRILNSSDKSKENDFTIIIQDYSRQHELQKIEEQTLFKTKLISSFSHELRTPLNSATLFIKAAIMDSNLTEELKEKYIYPSLSSLYMQNFLINDIIDFSQITANVLEIRYSTFTLNELIDELTELFQYYFRMKNLGLAFNINESVPHKIKSDYQRLLQIFVNILQNAQKFTSSGYVVIDVNSEDKSEITFSVKDEGYGMNSFKLQQVQEVLNQENDVTNQWQGFGLIISQMLLRFISPIVKNNLFVTSPGIGKGTIIQFTITNHIYQNQFEMGSSSYRKPIRKSSLPIFRDYQGLFISIKATSKSHLLLNQMSEIDSEYNCSSFSSEITVNPPQKYRLENQNLITSLNQLQFHRTVSQSKNEQSRCKCKRILSVDDEVFNQKSLELILSQLGFEVEIAYNGQKAINLILGTIKCSSDCQLFEVILMDCQMPVMDGWQTTKKLKQMMRNNEIPQMPIVALTAFTSSKDIEMCIQSGMDDVLHKPLKIKKFKESLSKLRRCE